MKWEKFLSFLLPAPNLCTCKSVPSLFSGVRKVPFYIYPKKIWEVSKVSGVLQMAVAIRLSYAFQQAIWNIALICSYFHNFHNFLNGTMTLDLMVGVGIGFIQHKDETSLLFFYYLEPQKS